MTRSHIDLPRWRVDAARTLAWALLLAGWFGLGSLAMALSAGPFGGFAAVALWLLALGVFSAAIVRHAVDGAGLRVLLAAAALLAGWGTFASAHGGGMTALIAAVLGWAMVVALASATVRSCRLALAERPGPPLVPATLGAALAWGLLGDVTDPSTLAPRLAIGVLAGAMLLASLQPRRSARVGCRAGLFDCSLPAWPAGAWREPERLPLLIATLTMLPMMCSLPLMVALCRSTSMPASAVVALHFAAMFAPALLLAPHRHRAGPMFVASACAALLGLGALAAAQLPGAAAGWALVVAHGAAWSLAWAALLDDRLPRTSRPDSPLPAAAVNAVLALGLGAVVAAFGLPALAALHVLLGVAGVVAGVLMFVRRAAVLPQR